MLTIFIEREACFEDQGGDYMFKERSLIPMFGNPPIRKMQGLNNKRIDS